MRIGWKLSFVSGGKEVSYGRINADIGQALSSLEDMIAIFRRDGIGGKPFESPNLGTSTNTRVCAATPISTTENQALLGTTAENNGL